MNNLALFDFDGTITTREMFPDFIRLAVTPGRLALGKLLLAPLIVGYKAGVVSGSLIRSAIVRFGFTGVELARLQACGLDFASRVLPTVLRPEALARIEWHRAQGDTVVVVSGGLDLYLQHWCATHGLALICSSLQHRDGRMTGAFAGAQCVRTEKPRRVRAQYRLQEFNQIYAYGDTREDLDLLALAHHKVYRWQPLAA